MTHPVTLLRPDKCASVRSIGAVPSDAPLGLVDRLVAVGLMKLRLWPRVVVAAAAAADTSQQARAVDAGVAVFSFDGDAKIASDRR